MPLPVAGTIDPVNYLQRGWHQLVDLGSTLFALFILIDVILSVLGRGYDAHVGITYIMYN